MFRQNYQQSLPFFVQALALIHVVAPGVQAQTAPAWLAHDMQRARPAVVSPGRLSLPVAAPSDATFLFAGEDLDEWRDREGGAAKWEIRDGAMVAVPGSGPVVSARVFGDVQLHVEWAVPEDIQGVGQGRGNSGVFLMSKYEVQILDSYRNDTYADGQAAAAYGQYPTLVNVCLPPGEWQSYEIFFRRPRFRPDGSLQRPARMTVVHNGVLVQDAVELWGPTSWLQHKPYVSHPERLPIMLQDHGNPVRFRNIWLRELAESRPPGPTADRYPPAANPTPEVLARYVGIYRMAEAENFEIQEVDGVLRVLFEDREWIDLVPLSDTLFRLRWAVAELEFTLSEDEVTDVEFRVGRDRRRAKRVGP